MQYRLMTKNMIKVSVLGFGCMRLPVINEKNSDIDRVKAIEMMRHAYDNGVNYFDTAYPYHEENSEYVVGEFLKTIDRSSIYLADKLPMWLCKEREDYEKYFSEQLKKLDTDYIDFYLTHSLSKKSFDKMKELDVFSFLDQKKKSGQIKYAGFSFHDEYEHFEEIVDSYPWDFCQIQLNYLDVNYQAGLKGLEYARSKGLDVIIMEPIKGGNLANLPKDALAIIDKHELNVSPSELALRWVMDKDIALLLSGMSNLDQVKENIKIAKEFETKALTASEKEAIKELVDLLNSKIKVACTSCEYCMPCPQEVNISGIFSRYNKASVFDQEKEMKESYKKLVDEKKDASLCVECGKCESLCPQSIKIIEKLKEADDYLR